MDSEKNPGGRPSNEDLVARRERIKEMMLQEISVRDMAQALGVSVNTVQADMLYWTDYFRQLSMNHPEVIKMQIAKVQQVLSEIDMVKKEYWAAYQKLRLEQDEQVEIKKKWRDEITAMKAEYQTAVENKNREEMRRLAKLIKENSSSPRLPSLHRAQLDNLKLIMDRIDKEAKLLNLFNPAASQTKMNTISLETLKSVMIVFKNIIMDMIPEDQRRYAFERLRRINIEELHPKDIVEAEVVEQPVIGLTRAEDPTQPTEPKSGEEPKNLEDLDI
jgi:hypothetical protein